MLPLKRGVLGLLIAALVVACGVPEGDVSTPPATPTGLTAEPGDAQVTLSWDANTEPALAGYNLYWGTNPDDLAVSRFVSAPTTTATVEDLTNGVEYHFAIDAEDVNGLSSERSEIVTAVPRAADLEPPSVTATHPQDGDTNVAINAAIRATFSKAMDRSATEGAFSADPAIDCAFGWNPASTVMTCTPAENLSENASYTITIDATAQDTGGLRLEQPYTFSFTTGDVALDICIFDQSTFGTCIFGN
jgi:hypothetical protein